MKLSRALKGLEKEWGVRPFVTLACAGGADQHWQIFHPKDMRMPAFTLMGGKLEEHHDSPLKEHKDE
jgi:hypothetical protein